MGGENMNSLTKAQQELVSQNLPVVHWVICDYIHVNPTICGLEYSDLFQEGCLWLCKAAATYKDDGRAQFSTYAKTVVKNGLLCHSFVLLHMAVPFPLRMIGHKRKAKGKKFFLGQPPKNRQFSAGNL